MRPKINVKSILSVALFIVLYLTIMHFSSWDELAKDFKSEINFDHQIKYGSMHLGLSNSYNEYENIIHIGYDPNGIYIKPFFLFSYKNPSLFLPWKKISDCQNRGSWVEINLKGTESYILFFDPDFVIEDQCKIQNKFIP